MSEEPRASDPLTAARDAPRCGAWARRTGLPCRSAAMANGRCRMHGGCSTGPRTAEGLARCAAAQTKHGRRNAKARAMATKRGQARSAIAALRRLLAIAQADDPNIGEDEIMGLLNLASP